MNSQSKRLSSPKEDVVVRAVCAFLELQKVRGRCIYWKVRNQTYNATLGRHLAPTGLGHVNGLPDVMVVLPGGRFVAVECKRPAGGRLSQAQKDFRDGLERIGGLYVVARSVDDVVGVFNADAS